MAKYTVNINVVLKHLDAKNLEIYQAFKPKEVERKELDRMLGYILPVWVSGIDSPRDQYEMVFRFNENVNLDWRELNNHPELRAKVLAAIGGGRTVRHDFHFRQAAGKQVNLSDLLERRYPDIRKDEIALWCTVNNESALIELCRNYGIQEKDQDAILLEHRRAVS